MGVVSHHFFLKYTVEALYLKCTARIENALGFSEHALARRLSREMYCEEGIPRLLVQSCALWREGRTPVYSGPLLLV